MKKNKITKIIRSFFIYFLFTIGASTCSTNKYDKLLIGKWTLDLEGYDPEYTPDVLLIRPDKKYLVFNSLDFVGLYSHYKECGLLDEKEKVDGELSDIVCDNDWVRGLIEKGEWSYNSSDKKLVLSKRVLIKEHSDYRSFPENTEDLTFEGLRLNDKEMILKRTSIPRTCDSFIKNFSWNHKPTDPPFYHEIKTSYKGKSSKTLTIPLSGYETDVQISYDFSGKSANIVFLNKKEDNLFEKEITENESKKAITIPIRGVTQLTIEITCKENTKWSIKLHLM